MKKMHLKQHGFSMIELLMTAFVLGVGLLGLAALMTVGVRSYSAGRSRDTAARVAGSILDSLAAEGRRSADLRLKRIALTGFRLANISGRDSQTPYYSVTLGSPIGFDINGQPVAAADPGAIYQANFVLRNVKAGVGDPASTGSPHMGGEVVANVSWTETDQNGNPITKWLSMSRFIRF